MVDCLLPGLLGQKLPSLLLPSVPLGLAQPGTQKLLDTSVRDEQMRTLILLLLVPWRLPAQSRPQPRWALRRTDRPRLVLLVSRLPETLD